MIVAKVVLKDVGLNYWPNFASIKSVGGIMLRIAILPAALGLIFTFPIFLEEILLLQKLIDGIGRWLGKIVASTWLIFSFSLS